MPRVPCQVLSTQKERAKLRSEVRALSAESGRKSATPAFREDVLAEPTDPKGSRSAQPLATHQN